MKGQGGRVAKEMLEELEANMTVKGREEGPRSKDEKILLPMEGCEQDRDPGSHLLWNSLLSYLISSYQHFSLVVLWNSPSASYLISLILSTMPLSSY